MVLLNPTIGQWYTNRSGAAFEVVAVDTNAIDIQFVDGTVDELDEDRWAKTTVEEIDTPNDCIIEFSDSNDSSRGREFASQTEWVDTLDFMDLEFVDMDDQSGHL